MFCELWRQDDNGQRFLVGRYASRDAAEVRLVALSRVPHKQTYWIVDIPDAPEEPTDSSRRRAP